MFRFKFLFLVTFLIILTSCSKSKNIEIIFEDNFMYKAQKELIFELNFLIFAKKNYGMKMVIYSLFGIQVINIGILLGVLIYFYKIVFGKSITAN